MKEKTFIHVFIFFRVESNASDDWEKLSSGEKSPKKEVREIKISW